MFKMILKNFNSAVGRILTLCLFLLVLAEAVFAIRFLDFSEYDFGVAGGGKGLRLVDFDVDAQKFMGIHYYKYPAAAGKTVVYEGIEISLKNNKEEGEVKVSCADAKKFEDFSISLLTGFAHGFPASIAEAVDVRTGHRVFWKTREDPWIQTGPVIRDTLNLKEKRKAAAADFEIFQFSGANVTDKVTCLFSTVVQGDPTKNNKERGFLGELTTTLTMTWFGYKQYTSKYGGVDHGFDGVFWNDSELFIAEAKNRKQERSAKKYMEECLAESDIAKVLPKLTGEAIPVREKILKFIQDSPEKIFKLVQRVLKDGTVQCFVESFNKDLYPDVGEEVYKVRKSDELGTVIESFSKGYPLAEVVKAFVAAMKADYKGADPVTDAALRDALEDALAEA